MPLSIDNMKDEVVNGVAKVIVKYDWKSSIKPFIGINRKYIVKSLKEIKDIFKWKKKGKEKRYLQIKRRMEIALK